MDVMLLRGDRVQVIVMSVKMVFSARFRFVPILTPSSVVSVFFRLGIVLLVLLLREVVLVHTLQLGHLHKRLAVATDHWNIFLIYFLSFDVWHVGCRSSNRRL